jgi:hypothetical protein
LLLFSGHHHSDNNIATEGLEDGTNLGYHSTKTISLCGFQLPKARMTEKKKKEEIKNGQHHLSFIAHFYSKTKQLVQD